MRAGRVDQAEDAAYTCLVKVCGGGEGKGTQMKVRSRAAGCSAQAPRDWNVSAGFESWCAEHHLQLWQQRHIVMQQVARAATVRPPLHASHLRSGAQPVLSAFMFVPQSSVSSG